MWLVPGIGRWLCVRISHLGLRPCRCGACRVDGCCCCGGECLSGNESRGEGAGEDVAGTGGVNGGDFGCDDRFGPEAQ